MCPQLHVQVLQTFDFDSVRVNVICVEADGHSPSKDEAIIAYLQSRNFKYHGHVDRNDWFVHSEFRPRELR